LLRRRGGTRLAIVEKCARRDKNDKLVSHKNYPLV
jgi:hypothetical protein